MKRLEVDRKKLSPMMLQYMKIKDEYNDEILFFRLGDFYEMFFEDAICVSRELELTLTGKMCGLDERVPMCGVPHHSSMVYIEKLVNKGYRVAICEQLEDAKDVKGMVKRGVVDVISKATITDYTLLDEKNNSYIASVLTFGEDALVTFCDISTGELNSITIKNNDNDILNEILNNGIKEVIFFDDKNKFLIDLIKNNYGIDVSISDMHTDKYEDVYKNINDVKVKNGIRHLFYYLINKYLKDLSHINECNIINKIDILQMDIHTVRNLELVETIRLKERTYSLLWLLDKCKTAMGSRRLKNMILNPIKDITILNKRYDYIDILSNNYIEKDNLSNLLNEVYDLERLCGKLTCGNVNGRDMIQLRRSLKVLPSIKEIIDGLNIEYDLYTLKDIYTLLDISINEDCPVTIREGNLIKEGYNKELDELRNIRASGKSFISTIENDLKNKTGIKNIKVGYNKVFGYYIEVSKSNIKDIKEEYGFERKQTLANCERYISKELKEKENLILSCEEKIIELEYNLFNEIKNTIKLSTIKIKKCAEVLSEIDTLISLTTCKEEYGFVRPIINNNKELEITDGFHPTVYHLTKGEYVKNDCKMNKNSEICLITGPNMSGKSTYMRQIAITVIMAQIGSFVPASFARVPIIDKIFTRIGASDDLVSGESTFMVEMKEARNAIVGASENSLVLFDELGRGTSTYDGMSLAHAILEYVAENIRCLCMFSTHYHEITKLSKKYNNIKNVHVSASTLDNEITFLHKVKEGSIDKSYGIHVAHLAGMPKEIITRANALLKEYEKDKVIQLELDFDSNKESIKKEEKEVLDKINSLDIYNLTPISAINLLYELNEKLKNK